MKSIFKSLFAAFAVVAGLSACSSDSPELGSATLSPDDLVEGVAFTITHDAKNPNIIYLKSILPESYQVAWETPQGRSVGAEKTLRIPFDGEYEVKLGVNTRGGYIWSEPTKFIVEDFCSEFVDNYLWTRISGGVGQSKTWQLDLGLLDDGSAKTTFWGGPHYFFTDTYTWENLHTSKENENSQSNYMVNEPWDANEAIVPNSDWFWKADYAGNSWMCQLDNYGYITFDLIGGANVTVTDANGNVVSKGTYMLDPEGFTLSLSDTYALETTDTRTHVRDFRVLYLSDDALQILALPDGVSLNYVTKEYFENPPAKPEPTEPTLPEGWKELLVSQNKYGSLRLDTEVPFDWCKFNGERKNGFKSAADYPANHKPYDLSDNLDIKFDTPDLGKYSVTLPDGNTVAGNYTISDNGVIAFSDGVGNYSLANGVDFTSNNGELRILSIEKDDLGRMSEIWLGYMEKDVAGNNVQYIGYHFLANFGGAEEKTYKATLNFNDTGTWTMVTGDAVFVKEGTFTCTVNTACPALSDGQDPLLWLDINNLLKDHSNADVQILDIKIDGSSISFDDSAISRSTGDDPNTYRRYVCNAWGLASCFPSTDLFKQKESAEVTFKVTYDTGASTLDPSN